MTANQNVLHSKIIYLLLPLFGRRKKTYSISGWPKFPYKIYILLCGDPDPLKSQLVQWFQFDCTSALYLVRVKGPTHDPIWSDD